jgi:hypothetical protein
MMLEYKLYQVSTSSLNSKYLPIAGFSFYMDAQLLLSALRREYPGLTFFYVKEG